MQAIASLEYTFLIICSPAKSYYDGGEINVLVAEKYSRAANGGVGFAKAAGNYAAQFYPTSEATKKVSNKLFGQILRITNILKKQVQ